jgi:hypothetical protein
MAWTRKDWIILLALTALGAGLRFYQLGVIPPGFQFDEAFNALDAQQVLAGNRPFFLPANAGREVLYTYFQAALIRLFGLDVYTLRLASAILGTVTIPVTYCLLRGLLRTHSRSIAAWTTLVLAISLWHFHFSRYGIRVISMPIIFSGAFGLAWLGAYGSTRTVRLLAYTGSGLLTGISVWTHPTGRLAPFVLIAFTLWLIWQHPRFRRFTWDSPPVGLVWSGLIALLVFLPLGLEFYRHPEFFFGHASEVSVFAERVSGNSPVATLFDNLLHILGMFSVAGDREWTHNLAGRPVFDLALSIPFYIGLAIWFMRIVRRADPDRDALALLAIWSLVMLFPSILSEAAPNYSRMMPALPALFTAGGLGLDWIGDLRRPAPWVGPALAVGIVLFSFGQATYDYFVRFAARPEVYYLYDADKLDALEQLSRFSGENQVYLSQLWGDHHATVYFLRWAMGIKSLDIGDTLVLPPPGKGAVYAFPAEQEERAVRLAALWPGVESEPLLDRFGNVLLHLVPVDAETAASWPPELAPTQAQPAHFSAAPTLLGIQTLPDDTAITLFWQAAETMPASLTSFVHLIDRDGRRIGQIDKLPGNASYPTTVWTPGERVIDRAQPALVDLCAGGETARVQVGWYDLADPGSPYVRADAPGRSALAGELTLPSYAYPRPYFEPHVRTNTAISPTLTLIGFTPAGDPLQPGSPLALDLVWHSIHSEATGAPAQMPVTLALAPHNNPGAETEIWQGSIGEAATWDPGFAFCRRLRATVPDSLPPGTYDLILHWDLPSGVQSANLGALTLGPSTRRFDVPDLAYPVDALLTDEQGGEIRLLGVSSLDQEAAGTQTALALTLVWQEQSRVEGNYKAFVHLLSDDGTILAQSDAVPAAGYATNRWVPDEVVLDRHVLALPEDLPPGEYQLVAGLYEPIGAYRLATQGPPDVALSDGRISLGTITLPIDR